VIWWTALAAASLGTGLPVDTTVVRGVVLEATVAAHGRDLSTRYEVLVEEVLRGRAESRVSVQLPGGVHDGLRRTVEGVPVWKAGDDVIVSLRHDGTPPLYGHFRVDGESLVPPLDGWPRSVAHLEEALAMTPP
jgi:hypothetical protein